MSDAEIPIGATADEEVTVTRELTVAARAPGMPEVYATPMMIYLMEIAAAQAIQRFLPHGSVSVGTEVNVQHLAATPVGFNVRASAKVTAVSGRIVTFAVEAHDGAELIGRGTHTRAVVDIERFNARMADKDGRPSTSHRHSSGRPEPGEYADYAQRDIDFVRGDDSLNALTAQAYEVVAFLESLDEERVRGLRYAAGKWTLKEVVGHMVDDERIFAYRALCVARRDARALPGFEEKDYVAATDFEQRTLGSLIAEYRIVRQATIALLEPLTPDEWLRRGTVNGYPATVRGLAFHIAGHELHHMRILREKYMDAAGLPSV